MQKWISRWKTLQVSVWNKWKKKNSTWAEHHLVKIKRRLRASRSKGKNGSFKKPLIKFQKAKIYWL